MQLQKALHQASHWALPRENVQPHKFRTSAGITFDIKTFFKYAWKLLWENYYFFRLWLIYNRGTNTTRTVPPLTLSKCWLIWVGTWDSCWVTLPTALQTSLTTCGNSGDRRRQNHIKIVQLTFQIPNKRGRNLNKTKKKEVKKWERIVFCLIYQNFSTHWSLSWKKATQFF